LARGFPQEFRVSPSLMLLTASRLVRDNAKLLEEVKRLRTAVTVYRELANRTRESQSR
jgi:hypothetical protein